MKVLLIIIIAAIIIIAISVLSIFLWVRKINKRSLSFPDFDKIFINRKNELLDKVKDIKDEVDYMAMDLEIASFIEYNQHFVTDTILVDAIYELEKAMDNSKYQPNAELN